MNISCLMTAACLVRLVILAMKSLGFALQEENVSATTTAKTQTLSARRVDTGSTLPMIVIRVCHILTRQMGAELVKLDGQAQIVTRAQTGGNLPEFATSAMKATMATRLSNVQRVTIVMAVCVAATQNSLNLFKVTFVHERRKPAVLHLTVKAEIVQDDVNLPVCIRRQILSKFMTTKYAGAMPSVRIRVSYTKENVRDSRVVKKASTATAPVRVVGPAAGQPDAVFVPLLMMLEILFAMAVAHVKAQTQAPYVCVMKTGRATTVNIKLHNRVRQASFSTIQFVMPVRV